MGSIKGVPRGKYKTKQKDRPIKVFCTHCDKSFNRQVALNHHVKTKHLNFKAFCPLCPRKFVSKSVCVRHLRFVHKIANSKSLHIHFTNNLELQQSVSTKKNNFESDESFPCMSNAVTQAENKKFGKHLIVSRDVNDGEVLIAASAFASIEYVSCIGECCFKCGKTENCKLIQCTHCIDVWFCSHICSLDKIHRRRCNTTYTQDDCKSLRLVIEIINVAFNSVADVKSLLDFCCGILFHNKKSKNCVPPFAQYGEILQLKGKSSNNGYLIAKRALKYVKLLPQFNSLNDIDRSLFHLIYRHATCLEYNTFLEKTIATKGGAVYRFSIYDILSRLNHH